MKKMPAAKENLMSRLVRIKTNADLHSSARRALPPRQILASPRPKKTWSRPSSVVKKSRVSLAMMEICKIKKSMLFQEQR